MRKRIEGLLLDIDGTLLDSNDAHATCWWEALREFGYRLHFHEVRQAIGMGGDNLLPILAKVKKDSWLGKQIEARRSELFREIYLPTIKAFPGTQQLIQELSRRKLKLILASSASEEDIKALLKQGNLESLPLIRLEKKPDHSKPDSDILELALEQLQLGPRSVMMLGDTPYDIEAAQRLHIRTVAFTCGGWSQDELSHADYIFSGPQEFLHALQKEEEALSLGSL